MAKKRKKDKEEEEYEFTPPDFDEKEFIRKELRDTKTVIITVAYGIVFGLIAAVVSSFNRDLVAPSILIGVAGAATLKILYELIMIDTSGFARKNWAGNMATFFFTFLAIFVLLLNYPFIDYADPTVDKVVVWVDDGSTITGIEYKYKGETGSYGWVSMTNESLASIISKSESSTVNITARIADTSGIAIAQITIGSSTALMDAAGEDRYEYSVDSSDLNPATGLNFNIFATDQNDNDRTFHPIEGIPVSA
ncbi:MAG TPA: hypothetical protein VGB78_02150 [Thermoplasmata archaeon]|jgi:hypothetical protein